MDTKLMLLWMWTLDSVIRWGQSILDVLRQLLDRSFASKYFKGSEMDVFIYSFIDYYMPTFELHRFGLTAKARNCTVNSVEEKHLFNLRKCHCQKNAPWFYFDFGTVYVACLLTSVLFFGRPRSEGWPHHGRTFSIYPCPLSFWLTLPRRVLSTSWCCPSRPYVAFLACVHLALFLALSLSPGNSLVSSWYDHSMLASLLWQCLTVPS